MFDNLTDDSQSAFLLGRAITHNIVVATEIPKGYRTKGISVRSVIKVDLHKAYDSVSWDFIGDML